MGLFGYNEKDYNKNTGILSNQMTALAEQLPWADARRILNVAIQKISSYGYIKTDGKAQKEIDDRIAFLIQSIRDDYQHGSQTRCYADANRLLSAIIDARQFGKERFTPEQLKAQEKIEECKARLKEKLAQKVVIQAKLDEIARKCENLNPESGVYQELEGDYADLEKDLEQIDIYIDDLTYQRDKLKDDNAIIDSEEMIETVESLEFMSDEEARRRRNKLDEKREKQRIKREQSIEERAEHAQNMRDGGTAKAKGSGLASRIAANKAKSAYDQIQESNVDSSAYSSESWNENSDSRPGRS